MKPNMKIVIEANLYVHKRQGEINFVEPTVTEVLNDLDLSLSEDKYGLAFAYEITKITGEKIFVDAEQ